jgi:hypothetical protein
MRSPPLAADRPCGLARQAAAVLLWLLIVLLPCQGFGLVQRQVTQPLHVHRATASAWWVGVQSFIAAWQMHRSQQATLQVHGRSAHGPSLASLPVVPPAQAAPRQPSHSHSAFERHHHAADDASVLALDDGPDDGSRPGNVTAPGDAPPPCWLAAVRADLSHAWLQSRALRVARWAAAPPERPPRA